MCRYLNQLGLKDPCTMSNLSEQYIRDLLSGIEDPYSVVTSARNVIASCVPKEEISCLIGADLVSSNEVAKRL